MACIRRRVRRGACRRGVISCEHAIGMKGRSGVDARLLSRGCVSIGGRDCDRLFGLVGMRLFAWVRGM